MLSWMDWLNDTDTGAGVGVGVGVDYNVWNLYLQ